MSFNKSLLMTSKFLGKSIHHQDGVLPGNPRPLASLRGSENLGRSEWLQGFGVVKKFCMFLMNSLFESGSCDLRSMPSFDAWFSGTFFSTI